MPPDCPKHAPLSPAARLGGAGRADYHARMIHVTTTVSDAAEAEALARAALGARQAACANIVPGVISLFHWKGSVAQEAEVMVVFKTTEALRAALVETLTDRHPYELPVITWETVGTTEAAQDWLEGETR